MLKSESQMYARFAVSRFASQRAPAFSRHALNADSRISFCSADSGEYWSIRLKQRVEDDVQLRDGSNLNLSIDWG